MILIRKLEWLDQKKNNNTKTHYEFDKN
ncbi:hypothetical protein FSAG_003111, partial [Fusobacterium periodonticum 2_1_31]